MRNVEALRRSGVGIAPDRPISEAAMIMEQAGVGSLAIIDGRKLIGIVTDRDLVRRGLALRLPHDARVDAVMSTPVVTINADADLHEAFAAFRTNAVRRLAVVRGEAFVGMVTVDDLLVELVGNLSDIARPVTAELLFGHHNTPLPIPV
jgi:CBS domain-containing protein